MSEENVANVVVTPSQKSSKDLYEELKGYKYIKPIFSAEKECESKRFAPEKQDIVSIIENEKKSVIEQLEKKKEDAIKADGRSRRRSKKRSKKSSKNSSKSRSKRRRRRSRK